MSIDLTLDRIRSLAKALPPYTRPTCHITGTNGKGSVSALLSSILLSSSQPLSVGQFNSPHLVSVNDCILLNGKPVSQDVYTTTRKDVETMNESISSLASSFELLTLTALQIFEQTNVDVAVIEVGMGGRLDATNIIPSDCILVSVLTAVDLDHQAYLGDSVVKIAREKAGIARAGKPFIVGPQKYADVEEMVEKVVGEVGAEVLKATAAERRAWDESVDGPRPKDFSFSNLPFPPPPHPVEVVMPCFPDHLRTLLPLHGAHQLENLGIVATVISTLLTHSACITLLDLRSRVSHQTISLGIQAVSWPGRLTFHSVSIPVSASDDVSLSSPMLVLVDGAHNPASSTVLSAYLSELLSADLNINEQETKEHEARQFSLTLILSLSDSPPKTPLETLSPLLSSLSEHQGIELNAICTRFTPPAGMPWVKCVPPSDLCDVVRLLAPKANVLGIDDGEHLEPGNMRRCFDWVAANRRVNAELGDELIVVAGSLYLVGDFYRFLNE